MNARFNLLPPYLFGMNLQGDSHVVMHNRFPRFVAQIEYTAPLPEAGSPSIRQNGKNFEYKNPLYGICFREIKLIDVYREDHRPDPLKLLEAADACAELIRNRRAQGVLSDALFHQG